MTGRSGNSCQEQHILGWKSALRLCGKPMCHCYAIMWEWTCLHKELSANEQRKAGTASPWSKCASVGTDKCLPSVWHFRRTLVGIAHQRTTLCISPVVLATMREIQNVVWLNAFPSVPSKPHSRQPSLSALLLGVATGEVSQAGESGRRLSKQVFAGLFSRQSAVAISYTEFHPR